MELYANTTEYNFDDPCYENGDTLKEKQKLRFDDYHKNDTKTAPVSKRYKFVGNLYDTEESLKAERATRSVRTYSCCCCFLGFTLGCVFATSVCVLVYYFVLPYLVPSPKGTQQIGCLKGWERYKGNCYFFSKFNMSWTDAQTNCTNMKSQLTDIEDQEEALYFASLTNYFIGDDAWIGGRGTNISNFKWFTGVHGSIPKVMNFTYWAQDKPSSLKIGKQLNSSPPIENCVLVWKQKNYKWTNEQCSKEKPFICKYVYNK
ncbi:perlucin-like protein isoform X1 [Mytilus trossulus]|uniref:perlucin-like protein isoform X1 n=1 Tax=Mytilus trossulus TaxID=6551 RepID=UPI003003C9CC